mmetsp:Transcript_12565/g.18854  ORF Transcript_12565/g.18854 Transcript_12565/m.18854 type:complete len:615 (+) Transcript_12565:3116-4960(+)
MEGVVGLNMPEERVLLEVGDGPEGEDGRHGGCSHKLLCLGVGIDNKSHTADIGLGHGIHILRENSFEALRENIHVGGSTVAEDEHVQVINGARLGVLGESLEKAIKHCNTSALEGFDGIHNAKHSRTGCSGRNGIGAGLFGTSIGFAIRQIAKLAQRSAAHHPSQIRHTGHGCRRFEKVHVLLSSEHNLHLAVLRAVLDILNDIVLVQLLGVNFNGRKALLLAIKFIQDGQHDVSKRNILINQCLSRVTGSTSELLGNIHDTELPLQHARKALLQQKTPGLQGHRFVHRIATHGSNLGQARNGGIDAASTSDDGLLILNALSDGRDHLFQQLSGVFQATMSTANTHNGLEIILVCLAKVLDGIRIHDAITEPALVGNPAPHLLHKPNKNTLTSGECALVASVGGNGFTQWCGEGDEHGVRANLLQRLLLCRQKFCKFVHREPHGVISTALVLRLELFDHGGQRFVQLGTNTATEDTQLLIKLIHWQAGVYNGNIQISNCLLEGLLGKNVSLHTIHQKLTSSSKENVRFGLIVTIRCSTSPSSNVKIARENGSGLHSIRIVKLQRCNQIASRKSSALVVVPVDNSVLANLERHKHFHDFNLAVGLTLLHVGAIGD